MPNTTYTIPGINLDLQDGGLKTSRAEAANVLIIGPSDGDDNVCHYDPIVITSKDAFNPTNYIGSYDAKNPLARGYVQMNSNANRIVAALPLPSNATIVSDTETEAQKLEKKIRAYMYLHNAFASLKYNVFYDSIILKNMYTDTYNFKIYSIDIGYLNSVFEVSQISSDGKIVIDEGLKDEWICVTPDKFTSEGQEKIFNIQVLDENIIPYSFVKINADGSIDKIIAPTISEEAFDAVYCGETFEGIKVDTDVTEEKKQVFDIAKLLAGFCYITSVTNKQILGFMAAQPALATDIVTTKSWVENLPEVKLNGYIQVTATPPSLFAMGGTSYPDTIEAAYCACVSSLESKSSTTNKTVPGLISISALLSSSQCASLAIKNYVTIRKKNNLFVVSDGVTAAGSNSDFARLTTVRITNEVINNIKDIGDPYIGEPNSTATRNALQAQIKEMMSQMQADGKITSFLDPEMIATTEDVINGDLKIMIAFFPVFEIRRINLVVALRQLA